MRPLRRKDCIEIFERDTKKKNDVIYAKLRDKCIGLRIRELDEEDVNEEYEPEYLGKVTAIIYKAKKEGGYAKGYYLEATEENDQVDAGDAHEGDDSDPDEPTPKRIFQINRETHDENIVQAENMQYKFKVLYASI
jgi:hypothetical protein